MKGETRSVPLAIVLTFVTCGIYYLFWVYWITAEFKNHLGKTDLSPGTETLLNCLCAPYHYYWLYKMAKLLQESQGRVGIQAEDRSILVLVLAFFGLGIVSMAIVQSDMNDVWAKCLKARSGPGSCVTRAGPSCSSC